MKQTPIVMDGIRRFRERFPNPEKVAFLMMRFADAKPLIAIHDALKAILASEGISLVRADDYQFAPELWSNILIYLDGCGFGVSVFEESMVKDYNPNVALETGYMMALGKPVCLLKEKHLGSLPTDILHRLYIDYDHFEIPGKLPERLPIWLRDNGLTTPCRRVMVSFDGKLADFGQHGLEQIQQGIVMEARKHGVIKFQGVNGDEGDSKCVLHFEADSFAASYLIKNEIALKKMTRMESFTVRCEKDEPADSNRPTNLAFWTNVESKTNCAWQFCIRDSFEGMENLGLAACKLLPGPTDRFEDVAIFITKNGDGFWYFHTNYQQPRTFRTVKAMATNPIGLQYVISAIISFNHELNEGEIARLREAHRTMIRYIFDPKVLPPDRSKLPLDSGGAKRIEILPETLKVSEKVGLSNFAI